MIHFDLISFFLGMIFMTLCWFTGFVYGAWKWRGRIRRAHRIWSIQRRRKI